jgi:hypothetical protein
MVLLALLGGCGESGQPAAAPADAGGAADAPGSIPDAAAVTLPDTAAPADTTIVPPDTAVAPADAAAHADLGQPSPDAGAVVWRPKPGTTWQWQLTGALDTTLDVQMYDLDLFETPQATIDALHAAGRTVICYFSAGSHEDFRADAAAFPAAAIGRQLDGWPGEHWLDTRTEAVRAVMKQRLDRAASKKCDGVEPDNVDGYSNQSGFPLTAATQLDYNRFLAREAHARGLSVGLKNDVEQVAALLGDFDWALNEECLQYDECDLLAPFITAGKAVFHVEYGAAALAQTVCPKTKALGFSTLIKKLDLDTFRIACP